MFLIFYHAKSLPLSLKVSCDKPMTIYGLNCSHLFKTWTIRGDRPPFTQEPLKSRFWQFYTCILDWGRAVVAVKLTSTGGGGLSKLTQVGRRGGGGKKELKNCLTSFVNVLIHTPILGKTQSIRELYIKYFTDNIQDTVNNRT